MNFASKVLLPSSRRATTEIRPATPSAARLVCAPWTETTVTAASLDSAGAASTTRTTLTVIAYCRATVGSARLPASTDDSHDSAPGVPCHCLTPPAA